MFVDEIKIYVKGGDGGNGCNSTHREIYVPKGGPDGGPGGRGGNVFLEGSYSLNTLNQFRKRVHLKAKRGQHGMGNNKSGREAQDLTVMVPLGTTVFDVDTGRFIGEVLKEGQKLMVARGGRGGRGNAAFATANYRVPRFSEKGEPGQERWIRLELRTIAHVGLIGLPNAGKSTLLSVITRAKPKIADYPFTTLHPNLGVIEKSVGVRYIVADIPGLIEGASKGLGLGHRFLRHVSRTRLLLHVIDLTVVDPEKPLENYNLIINELSRYSDALASRPGIVAANKTDVAGTEEAWFALETELAKLGVKAYPVSAASGEGLAELSRAIFDHMEQIGDDPLKYEKDTEDFVVVDETTEELRPFTIEAVKDYFVVRGRPEKMVSMTYIENEEAVRHLQMRLKRMGVEEELKRMGVKEGDFVVIGDYEFNYVEEKDFSE